MPDSVYAGELVLVEGAAGDARVGRLRTTEGKHKGLVQMMEGGGHVRVHDLRDASDEDRRLASEIYPEQSAHIMHVGKV